MRLSLARRFWNQILICVSVNCNRSANSNRLPREIYSFRWNSTSKRMVCSLLNVVRCRLGRPSFRLRRATMQISHDPMERKRETKTTFLLHMIRNDARKQLFFLIKVIPETLLRSFICSLFSEIYFENICISTIQLNRFNTMRFPLVESISGVCPDVCTLYLCLNYVDLIIKPLECTEKGNCVRNQCTTKYHLNVEQNQIEMRQKNVKSKIQGLFEFIWLCPTRTWDSHPIQMFYIPLSVRHTKQYYLTRFGLPSLQSTLIWVFISIYYYTMILFCGRFEKLYTRNALNGWRLTMTT